MGAAVVSAIVGVQLLFIGLDLWERHRTRASRRPVRPETVGFLVAIVVLFLLVQAGLMLLAPRVETMMAGVRAWFADRGVAVSAEPMPWGPVILVSVVAFYLGGLFDYVLHRFFNHSRWFWWTHEYHHLPREVFVALPGLSVRPFSVFTAIPTAFGTIVVAYGLIAAAGWPLWDLRPLGIVAVANATILTTSHSQWLRRSWWPHDLLRWLGITTPQEHLVHHTVDRPGNYGNLVTGWDRLFGTYRDPRDLANQNRRLGLTYDQDFLGTLTFGRFKLSPQLRRRFQIARYCHLDEATEVAGAMLEPPPDR